LFIVLTLVLTALHAPGMTKVVRHASEDWNDEHATLVIPGKQRETRNPVSRPWIPAFAGMTDREPPSVSASPHSAMRYE
jgi:hypothetical protein